MEQAAIMYVVLAIGGIVAGNIIGGLTRGGGGVVGRTIFGAIGGLALGWAAGPDGHVEMISNVAANWSNLMPANPEPSKYLGYLITGGIGGAVLGLIAGLLVRPRG
jgi:hypothetical protein